MLQQISYQEKTSQFINGLVVVQSLNFKETSGEWIESLISFITSPEVAECHLVGAVNHTYQEVSTKHRTT